MKIKEMHPLVKTDLGFSTGFPAQVRIRIWFMSGFFFNNKTPSQPPMAFISLFVKLNCKLISLFVKLNCKRSMQTFLCCAMLQIKNLGLGNASLQSFPICNVSLLQCPVETTICIQVQTKDRSLLFFKVKKYSMRIIPFKEPLKSCCENHAIYNESKEEIPITEFIIQEFCTVIFILWSHRNS